MIVLVISGTVLQGLLYHGAFGNAYLSRFPRPRLPTKYYHDNHLS